MLNNDSLTASSYYSLGYLALKGHLVGIIFIMFIMFTVSILQLVTKYMHFVPLAICCLPCLEHQQLGLDIKIPYLYFQIIIHGNYWLISLKVHQYMSSLRFVGWGSDTCGLNQYKDAILPVKEIPLWRYDDLTTVLSLQWDFLYWYDGIFTLNQGPSFIH